MRLKVLGKTTTLKIDSICRNHYKCDYAEFEISKNFIADQTVNIMHSRKVDSTVIMTIAANNMSVEATFVPPINGGHTPSLEEAAELAFSSANVHLSFADVEAFENAYSLMKKGNIVDSVTVAAGKPPTHGKDAKVQIFFEMPSNEPPKDADGNANYKQMRRYINVRAEQILARVIPATTGNPGMTVNLNPIQQVPGKMAELTAGDGVKMTENGTQFSATTDGYITYKRDVLSVNPVIEIRGDVDYNIGNIDFVGTVDIVGDIHPGFVVKGKDVNLRGICQDASIIAENSVTVKGGIKGRNNLGTITAGGIIDIDYCEGGVLNAKGAIIVHKYTFNSVLNSGDTIKADYKSTIAGGSVISFAGGTFYNLGTKANTKMEIIVGRKYDTENKLVRINEEKKRLIETMVKIKEAIDAIEETKNPQLTKHPKYIKLVETRELITKRLNLFEKRIDSIIKESVHSYPVVEVLNEIQEGVNIRFFDSLHHVRKNQKKVRFVLEPSNQTVECLNI
ncbi:MAG: FapA family protein [Deferribacteraceae bacterium]|jgi:uncharacterized protein (DUF342 family)|nr:FapA family protein [Deferribacteraceae bacterium]